MKKFFVILVLLCSVTSVGAATYVLPTVGDLNTWGADLNNYLNAVKMGINVEEYGATGDGATDDRTAINNAATAAANNTLYFPAGTYKISSDITIGSTVSMVFDRGASLSIDNTFTVTINGTVEAGWHTIFSGDGVVAYNGVGPVKYNWFGTGVQALQDAIDFLGTGSRTILLPGGDVNIGAAASGVTIDQVVIIKGQGRPVYDGAEGTRIIYTGAGIGIFIDNPATSVVLQDFQLQGSGTGANGIKIGDGTNGVTQPQLKNIGIDDFTAAGLEIDFVVAGLFESISIKACDVGLKVVQSYRVVYNDFSIVNSIGIGLHLESGSAGEIAYNKFTNFNFTNNGEEAVNIGGTGGIRNNVFDTFQMETSQALAGRTDGYYHWLVGSDGNTSKQIRNTIKNVFFSNFSRTPADDWDGTTGNRCLMLQNGRWYIENLNSEFVGFGGVDVFKATQNTLLNLGNITERELSRWEIPVTVETVCTVAPIKGMINVLVAGTGAWEDVVTFTIPKNTTGGQTNFAATAFYADGNNDEPGGTVGIHVIVHGKRTTSGANTSGARITLNDVVLTDVAEANNDQYFMMETWVWNRSAAGIRHVTSRNLDGTTMELETSGPTIACNAAQVLAVEGIADAVSAGVDDLYIYTVFIERF